MSSTVRQRADLRGIVSDVDELIQLRFSTLGLDLWSGSRVQTYLVGGHHSAFRGRGIDFDESRYYQPGDDIRHMDWRVTARTGHPHTKVFREERERPIFLIVDQGPSMRFGTRVAFKSVIAARTAALFGWTAVNGGDRVGAFIFGVDPDHEIRPAGGRRGVLRLIRSLAEASQQTLDTNNGDMPRLGNILAGVRRVVRPGSLIVMLSDFRGLDAEAERHLTRLRQHNDLLACFIYDGLEGTPPPPARYSVTDGRTIAVVDTADRNVRRDYQAGFQTRLNHVVHTMHSRSIPLWQIGTHQDPVEILRRGFAVRTHKSPRFRKAG